MEAAEAIARVSDGRRAAVEPAIGREGPLLLRRGARVEVGCGQLARLREVADAVKPRPMKLAQRRVRLGELHEPRPQLDAVEEIVAPLPGSATEELVVAPDLRLEPLLGQIEPAP